MDAIGFGPQDVPAARRAVFDVAVEQACAQADPHDDFDRWVEVLWGELAELFGWEPQPWPISQLLPPDGNGPPPDDS